MDINELRNTVRRGEGSYLEFKRKARHPDKIAREMLAFANTRGGLLLIGVDDNTEVYGVKFPDEDIFAIQQFLDKYTYPKISFEIEKIKISSSHFVLAYQVEESHKKPHFMKSMEEGGKKSTFVRVNDMSITASREMVEILRMEGRQKGVRLRVGDREKELLTYLEKHDKITLEETQKQLKLNKRRASSLLVILVRAGLLNIHPSEKGDSYSLATEAFS
ncbi:MAG: putative DNA binding domain-containing protein [Bacteroidia bacterium]|nr:putative DNA binding domain-containing protein [Bacteroidia bacterium]